MRPQRRRLDFATCRFPFLRIDARLVRPAAVQQVIHGVDSCYWTPIEIPPDEFGARFCYNVAGPALILAFSSWGSGDSW